ncbi:MAG: 50S ribosomal protein L31 [Anaerolineaceae bacterium]|nr:50S ribosomal protein L31 [Anaerolineaceae bacterium]
MKKDIQPKYYPEAEVTCASCGATWKTGSTRESIRTEVCSNCHPFYTGQLQRILDVEGQVDRFYKRLQAREQYLEDKTKRESERTSPNRAIDELELSSRAKEALRKADVLTAGDVLARLEEGEKAMLDIEGFGRKSLIDLKKQLRQLGYDLPEADDLTV